eukprot:6398-Heterococcus_DN1.PRE.1
MLGVADRPGSYTDAQIIALLTPVLYLQSTKVWTVPSPLLLLLLAALTMLLQALLLLLPQQWSKPGNRGAPNARREHRTVPRQAIAEVVSALRARCCTQSSQKGSRKRRSSEVGVTCEVRAHRWLWSALVLSEASRKAQLPKISSAENSNMILLQNGAAAVTQQQQQQQQLHSPVMGNAPSGADHVHDLSGTRHTGPGITVHSRRSAGGAGRSSGVDDHLMPDCSEEAGSGEPRPALRSEGSLDNILTEEGLVRDASPP